VIRVTVWVGLASALGPTGRFGFGLLLLFAFVTQLALSRDLRTPAARRDAGQAHHGLAGHDGQRAADHAGRLPDSRNLLRAVDCLPAFYGFAVVTMLLRADGRRLGDLAAGTLVVYRAQAAGLREASARLSPSPRRFR
jgi:uncharacterized RDD family membrane protein YckC